MADGDELRRVIAGLGALLGVPELELDEDGECALEAGEVMLHMQYFEDVNVLVGYADLGVLPQNAELAAARLLLAGNLSWRETAGGALAVHPELHRAGLVVRLDVEDLTAAALRERIGDLIEAGQLWMERLGGLRGGHQSFEEDYDPRLMAPIRG
jgi:hypothetical protein